MPSRGEADGMDGRKAAGLPLVFNHMIEGQVNTGISDDFTNVKLCIKSLVLKGEFSEQ